jgi:amino acid adenylation domain-containing protein
MHRGRRREGVLQRDAGMRQETIWNTHSMNISDIVDKALEHGVVLYIEDDRLKYRAKKGGLTQELKNLVQARRDELIVHLKKMGSESASKRIPLIPQAGKHDVPLSFGQQRLWFVDRLGEGSSQYNCLSTFRLTGPFDREAFGRAVKTVVERHEILRTVVAVQDGEPRQIALEQFAIEPVEVDLAGATDAAFDEAVRGVQSQESSYEFDLERDLMVRVHLIARCDEDHAVVVNVHHIATDAWSMRVLVAELGQLYGAYRQGLSDPLPPLPLQYSDYALWQRRWLEGEELERQIAYWKHRLAGIPAAHGLPLERARADVGGNPGDSVKFALDARQLERAEALCRTYDTTLFVLLETVFAVLVGRCSQATDIVLGTPTFGRNRQELESLIGFFINTIALRTDLAGDPSFEDLLRRNHVDVLKDYDHQFLPFETIVQEINPPREANLSPVFQIMFTVERESDDWSPFPSLTFDRVSKQKETIKYEIVFSVHAVQSGPQLRLAFNTELFDVGAMRCMCENYAALLDGILADASRPIDDYRLAHEAVVVRIAEEMAAHPALAPLSAVAGAFAVVGVTGGPTPLGGVGELVYGCDTNAFDAGSLAFCENDIADLPGRYLLRTGLAARVGADRVASFPVSAVGSDRPPSERTAVSAPSGPIEEGLARIWQSILQVEAVGREDNFFRLGGHSLLVMQLVSAIREEFGCEPGIRDIFERPMLAELAGFIAAEAARNALPPIVHLDREGGLPLSYAQQRLWFIDRMEGGSVHYNMLFRIRFREAVDEDAFAEAVRQIVQRHEVLRTHYVEVEGEPRQFVREAFRIEPRIADIGHLDASEQDAEFNRLCREEVLRPFDLGADLMLRALLVKFNDGYARAIFTQHHIASDGWSIQLLKRELTGIYKNLRDRRPIRLKRLAAQYADYAGWQRSWLQGEVLAEEQAYWRDRLAGIPQIHSLPLDKSRPQRQTFEARVYHRSLPDDIAAGIRALAADHGMTLFMVLQTAFAIVLSRYSRERDIVMGSPISGRVHRDLEPMLGFFVNTLVLRSDVDAERTVASQLEANRTMLLEAFHHQHIPFEYLVEVIKPKRSLSHPPIFQIMFSMLEAGSDAIESAENDTGDSQRWSEGIEKFDLTLTAIDGGERVGVVWSMNAALFEEASIERLHASLEHVLSGMVSTPEAAVGTLALMDDASRHHLLETLAAGAGVAYPREVCLHELFAAQAGRTPEAEAVVYEDQVLRFGALEAGSNRLAHYLAGCGVEPGDRVALCLPRGPELVTALLGIWKSGAAYVPLDPEAPEARQRMLLEDSAPRLLLTVAALDGGWSSVPVVVLDASETVAVVSGLPATAPELRSLGMDAGHAAYVIYTSGSTGVPKGVVVEHRSVVHLWRSLEGLLAGHGPGPWRVGLNASVIFDASVQSLVQLLSGHAVVVVPQACRVDPRAFLAYMREQRLDVFDCTPALLELLVAEGLLSDAGHAPLAVLVGGEAIASGLWRTLREAPRTVFYNNYGPTECTVQATACALPSSGAEPTLGGALGNARLYVLDAHGEPVPVGVPGELWIGGDGVARGYWNRPALTAERFVRDRFVSASDARMYRTGDLCRWLPEGTLAYLGRTDFQVKLRGYRIELGEIESQLSSCAGVGESVVLARELGGERRLVGYVRVESGSEVTAGDLKARLSERLPGYMVPSSLVLLEAWPLTPNGKVDRGALPAPEELLAEGTAYVAPRTALEEQVSAVWSEVLGVPRVGATDNFFELGGHSLLAVKVVAEMRKRLGIEVSVVHLFEYATVAELSAFLAGAREGSELPASMRQLAAPKAGAAVFHCIPGVAALAKDFAPIAAAMRSRGYGVKAFDHRGVLDDVDPHAGIAEIADALAAEIAADLEGDVCRLVGHSFGGPVALEIAKRLRDAGKTVHLFLLDVYFEQGGSRYAIAKRSGGRRWPRADVEGANVESADVEGEVALKARVKRIREHQESLFSEYVPQGTDAIHPLCVFAAESGVDRAQYTAYLSGVFRDGFRSVLVDGDHFTMLAGAGAEAIADALDRSVRTDAATTGAVP